VFFAQRLQSQLLLDLLGAPVITKQKKEIA